MQSLSPLPHPGGGGGIPPDLFLGARYNVYDIGLIFGIAYF